MKSINDVAINEQFGLLIQGPPKTGKTRLASLFPSPWLANCDSNIAGFARECKEQSFASDLKLSDIMRDDTGKPIVDERVAWKRFQAEHDKAVQDPTIQTVVWDSATTLTFLSRHFIPQERKARTGKGESTMELQDWNTYTDLWKTMIMKVRASGKYLIIIAHDEAVKTDENGGIMKLFPNMSGNKLQSAFAGFFSDVWHTEIVDNLKLRTKEFAIRVQPNNLVDCGGSLGVKVPTVAIPDTLQATRDLINSLLEGTFVPPAK